MMSRWRWIFLQMTRRLWMRAALFAVLGVGTALAAVLVQNIIPWDLPANLGADSVDRILNILASSMLAVTTFSLSVMIAAYSAATNNVTPRATKLLMQDTTTQNVLATFVGSFLFSLVGIVALSTGIYGEQGRVVLFIVTLAVIVLIAVTILRWIDHLSRLGRMGETTDRVEQAATKAILARAATPTLGAQALLDAENTIPAEAVPIFRKKIGYVQHLDVGALNSVAEKHEGEIYVVCLPGAFVHHAQPLAWVTGIDDEGAEDSIRAAFTIAEERTFDQDPRFGLAVMAEIGSRALSPATNDSGTAIDVIGRAVRLLANWKRIENEDAQEEVRFPRVFVPPLDPDDMFDDIFSPLARDGAGLIEIQIRLLKALSALARMDDETFRSAAIRHARLALTRAETALPVEEEKEALRMLYEELKNQTPPRRPATSMPVRRRSE